MSTRGVFGFVVDDEMKITYNHCDSYPSGLGNDILEWLSASITTIDATKEKARALKIVDEDEDPTKEELEQFQKYHNTRVSSGDDWYSLLRETQGNPGSILDCGYMIDSLEFASNGLFCEWGYVIDLDNSKLEIYKGFQQSPHTDGRFKDMKPYTSAAETYYPLRLIGVYSFHNLPDALTKEEMEFWCGKEDEDDF